MILEYPNIVVGSDLRAMLFAFMNGYPIFFTEARKPHEFESLNLTHDLSFLDIDNESNVYKSFIYYNKTRLYFNFFYWYK